MLKDFPGAIAVVSISVYDGQSFDCKVVSQLMDGYSSAVKVAASTEEMSAGMMIPISGEDKGIIYFPPPYSNRCRYCARG